jgi:flagellar export protein FliJ
MTSERLARLVRIRKLVEQSRAQELADSQRSLDEAAGEADATRDELDQLDESVAVANPTASELQAASRYQGHLQKRLQGQAQVVQERAAEVDAGRDEVREAWRERRLMEGVHERAAAEESAEAETSERKANEAIALSIYTRRTVEEEE